MEINWESISVMEDSIVIEFDTMANTITAVNELLTYYGANINGENMEVTVSSIKITSVNGDINLLGLIAMVTGGEPLKLA